MPTGIYNHLNTKNPIYTKERNKKIGEANKGKKHTEEWKRKISIAHKGKKLSEKHKRKISEALKGKNVWSKGRKLSKKTRLKMSKARRGKSNPSWKGGISSEDHKIRRSIEFRLWREAVFARDNWTCQKCGIKSGMGKAIILHPHHIQNFSQYPELRFAIDNGVTFCKECHKEFHRKYGIKNNTKGQLEEFLINI